MPVSKQQAFAPDEVGFDLVRLIEGMANGEESALAAFYDATRRQVYGLAMAVLKDESLAEEVTLDVYMQVWRTASRYRRERGSPLAWLITLARSRAIDRRRVQKPPWPTEVEDEAAIAEPAPENLAIADERARKVRSALAGLSSEQRQVVVLSYFRGLSHGEIARCLDLPLGTVKTRIRTGMQRLHQRLAPQLDEEK